MKIAVREINGESPDKKLLQNLIDIKFLVHIKEELKKIEERTRGR